ncbi:MAG: hypothetical protein IJG38_06370, partial [Thermoguttaceae bacterium]|nr:hypothetical protein [Thermoguttaceae bacterium]
HEKHEIYEKYKIKNKSFRVFRVFRVKKYFETKKHLFFSSSTNLSDEPKISQLATRNSQLNPL